MATAPLPTGTNVPSTPPYAPPAPPAIPPVDIQNQPGSPNALITTYEPEFNPIKLIEKQAQLLKLVGKATRQQKEPATQLQVIAKIVEKADAIKLPEGLDIRDLLPQSAIQETIMNSRVKIKAKPENSEEKVKRIEAQNAILKAKIESLNKRSTELTKQASDLRKEAEKSRDRSAKEEQLKKSNDFATLRKADEATLALKRNDQSKTKLNPGQIADARSAITAGEEVKKSKEQRKLERHFGVQSSLVVRDFNIIDQKADELLLSFKELMAKVKSAAEDYQRTKTSDEQVKTQSGEVRDSNGIKWNEFRDEMNELVVRYFAVNKSLQRKIEEYKRLTTEEKYFEEIDKPDVINKIAINSHRTVDEITNEFKLKKVEHQNRLQEKETLEKKDKDLKDTFNNLRTRDFHCFATKIVADWDVLRSVWRFTPEFVVNSIAYVKGSEKPTVATLLNEVLSLESFSEKVKAEGWKAWEARVKARETEKTKELELKSQEEAKKKEAADKEAAEKNKVEILKKQKEDAEKALKAIEEANSPATPTAAAQPVVESVVKTEG